MTICNYCERRETRSNKFPLPFTCIQCLNQETNYANNEDDDIITYIDGNGKHIKINIDTELNVETINDKPIDRNNFKDELLESLYCRVDDLQNELAEKNLLIRSLIINSESTFCETDNSAQHIQTSQNDIINIKPHDGTSTSNIDFEMETEWASETTINSKRYNNKANSTQIIFIDHQEEKLRFADPYLQFVQDSKKQQEPRMKLQQQLKEVRRSKTL